MTDSVDYIYPGSVFLCFGLLSTLNTFYLSVVGKVSDAAMCQSLTGKLWGVTVPLEGVAKVLLCLIGVVIEMLTSSKTNIFLASQDNQEMTIYCFYMFAAFIECCAVLSSAVERRITLLAYSIASFSEAYLTYHFVESREGGCIIMCWSLIAFIQGIAFLMQSCSFGAIAVIALKNTSLILHGSWFWHIGFSDYIYTYNDVNAVLEEPDAPEEVVSETVKVSAVASAFSLHVLFCFMFVALVHMALSIFLGKRDEGSRSVSRCEAKPLISDGEDSEMETTEFQDMNPASDAKTDRNANKSNNVDSNQLQF